MTQSIKRRSYPTHWLSELSGSLGDLGTFLPLCLGLHLACGLLLTHTLFFAGIAHLITAIFYRIPMPVQPMKAIAAMAIAGGLSPENIYLAGLLTAAVLLLFTFSGSLQRLLALLPLALIRGVQCLIAALLLKTALKWLHTDLTEFYQQSAWSVMALIVVSLLAAIALLLTPNRHRIPLALLLTTAGFAYAAYASPSFVQPSLWLPTLSLPELLPNTTWLADAWLSLELATAQLPMTLLNSVAAVVLLSRDLYPNNSQPVTANKLGYTVSGLNFIAPFFGGMPVCHGSGGLAAQHQFGARSHYALIWLGMVKILFAVGCGAALVIWIQTFPLWLLSILLIGAAIPLLRHGLKLQGWSAWLVASTVVVIGLLTQSLYGILAGVALSATLSLTFRLFDKPSAKQLTTNTSHHD